MRVPFFALLFSIVIISVACNQAAEPGSASPATAVKAPSTPSDAKGKVIATAKSGAITVTLANPAGHLKDGENDFTVQFTDQQGKPVDIGASTIWFEMPAMGSMAAMKSNVKLVTTATPGIYQASTTLDMGGTWTVHVKFKGAAGDGQMEATIQAS